MSLTPFDLAGKVALVTGGNGGIGLGMSKALAAAGATTIIWGTNEEKNAEALETIRQAGGKGEVRRVDVSAAGAVAGEMARIVAEHGRIDAVFANAVYLASDGSRFHTADTFTIDGGYAVY